MTARVETIMAAIAASLTGLATTGASVQRVRPWAVSQLPALSINQGENLVSDSGDAEIGTIYRRLSFTVTAYDRSIDVLETELNQISAEVYEALTADRTLGLAYVYDLNLDGDAAPEVEAVQDEPTARLVMLWSLLYGHSETSAEA